MTRSSKINYFFIVFISVFCFLFLINETAAAEDLNQKILNLRKQIEDLTKQSEQYKKNIQKSQKDADTLTRQINIMNNEILSFQTQIAITEKKIETSKSEISVLETRIFDTQDRINDGKNTISQLIQLAYQRDRVSLTAILLKSPKLSDFANISQQEQNLNLRLNVLLTDLKQQKDELQNQKSDFEGKKRNLETLNEQNINQKNTVSESKNIKDKILIQTKGKEKEYQKLLSDVEAKEKAFFNELKKLEDEAVKSGAFIVHVTATSIPPKGTKIFKWPEDGYYITQGYGMTAYAKRGAYGGAPHNGIDIVSGYGSAIHAAADGAILASGINDGWGNWTAIRHNGELVTIYTHMRAPSGIANGTPVTISSIIGYEGNTGNATGSHLHFSVYRDFFTYINPKNGQLYFNYFDGSLNPLDYLY